MTAQASSASPLDILVMHSASDGFEIGEVFNCVVYFSFGKPRWGFGQLSFDKDKSTGEITCMNECMDRETVRKILHAFADHVADKAILDEA